MSGDSERGSPIHTLTTAVKQSLSCIREQLLQQLASRNDDSVRVDELSRANERTSNEDRYRGESWSVSGVAGEGAAHDSLQLTVRSRSDGACSGS